MSPATKTRRRQHRYPIQRGKLARVEFTHPSPNGRRYDLDVTNVSSSGVSFSIENADELTGLEEGTSLAEVVVRIGDCMIRGEMLVMHVTEDTGSRRICGALFYPATNLEIGFRYLAGLIVRYGGDPEMALLAYNRGPARVEQLLVAGRDPRNGYASHILDGYLEAAIRQREELR